MGYVFATGQCIACHKPFSFNPGKVPSIKDKEGIRQPICSDCFSRFQLVQKENGLLVWPNPSPEAYSPCDEADLR